MGGGGINKVIAYASRSLKPSEKNNMKNNMLEARGSIPVSSPNDYVSLLQYSSRLFLWYVDDIYTYMSLYIK